jgi:hypothetical protein
MIHSMHTVAGILLETCHPYSEAFPLQADPVSGFRCQVLGLELKSIERRIPLDGFN